MEEHPRFTTWVQKNINPHFAAAHYLKVHFSGLASLVLAALAVWLYPRKPLVLLLFTLLLTPSFFCNVFFHARATLLYRSHCPGPITAIAVHLPLYGALCNAAFTSGQFTVTEWWASTLLAACVHIIEVRHNVFRFTAAMQRPAH